jgi:hypothetical protein
MRKVFYIFRNYPKTRRNLNELVLAFWELQFGVKLTAEQKATFLRVPLHTLRDAKQKIQNKWGKYRT